MFYIYLQVLFRGQAHGSCRPFRDPLSKNFRVVLDHGLDARLVMLVVHSWMSFVMLVVNSWIVALPLL